MRKFKCDNCGREVEEKYLVNFPINWMSFDPQDPDLTVSGIKQKSRYIDLCITCFRLYSEKLNKLYDDFTRQLKDD